MSNAKKKQKPRPQPKPNRQIPISMIKNKMNIFNPSELLMNAREHPIYGCWVMEDWHESGITPVVVAREQEPGYIMFGCYMIDLYCLGIKTAFVRTDFSLAKFQRMLPKLCSNAPEVCTVELAHEIIYGGMEYAERYGFEPNPDFTALKTDMMLDAPDAHPRVNNVVFGNDGQPFYISGPFDDNRKIKHINDTLTRTAGEGNFKFIVNLGGMGADDDF